MINFLSVIAAPLRRIDRRLRAARPGAALILVVAMLVILSLMGTAMITRARLDRYSVQQHSARTQTDGLVVDTIVEYAEKAVLEDLFDAANNYRPAGSATYDHWDSPHTELTASQNDAWLGERVPAF